ncbi:MAG: L-threonylcarbamoyladenylate synthase [Neisseriaceae bacterium]|nr:L-threonylcarbamoyladenylate synthase [Neisseriaceae bacterium]MBP6863136.1 L-threonylcarbamoyladenylate synthase [Neisseriaceae bacterium]
MTDHTHRPFPPRVASHAELLALKAHLKQGGVIAYPTGSCFGLGGLPTHPRAIRQIIKLKKRPQHKGLIVIGAAAHQFKRLIKPLSTEETTQVNQYWPGPYTFLCPNTQRVLPSLRGQQNTTLAVRVDAQPVARHLCRRLNTALISTSANFSGGVSCKTTRQTQALFGHAVMMVPGQIGHDHRPSTIFDLKTGQKLR